MYIEVLALSLCIFSSFIFPFYEVKKLFGISEIAVLFGNILLCSIKDIDILSCVLLFIAMFLADSVLYLITVSNDPTLSISKFFVGLLIKFIAITPYYFDTVYGNIPNNLYFLSLICIGIFFIYSFTRFSREAVNPEYRGNILANMLISLSLIFLNISLIILY